MKLKVSQNITAKFENYLTDDNRNREITAETWRLFDFLMMIANKRGFNKDGVPTVRFTLDEYIEARGLKLTKRQRQNTRERIKKEIDTLYKLSIGWEGKNLQNQRRRFRERLIIGEYDEPSRGVVFVKFNPALLPYIEASAMPYPKKIWTIDLIRNPHSFYLGRKISLHKKMNNGKTNADFISVNALLKSCPVLPKYQQLRGKGQIKQRIINPFERDMDELDFFEWHYVNQDKEIVDRKNITGFNAFITLNVKIDWKSYPEIEQKRVEGDNERDSEMTKGNMTCDIK